MKKIVSIAIIFLIVTLPGYAQCAMCRAVLESEEGKGIAQGVNDGIIYLMIIPYILIGGIGFLIYKKLKSK